MIEGCRGGVWSAAECVEHVPDDDVDGLFVLSAFGDDEMGKLLSGSDMSEVHGPDGSVVLRLNGLNIASSAEDVAFDAAHQADIVGRVDVEPKVENVPHGGHGEEQDSLDDDDFMSLDVTNVGSSGVSGEVVLRAVDRLSSFECAEVGARRQSRRSRRSSQPLSRLTVRISLPVPWRTPSGRFWEMGLENCSE